MYTSTYTYTAQSFFPQIFTYTFIGNTDSLGLKEQRWAYQYTRMFHSHNTHVQIDLRTLLNIAFAFDKTLFCLLATTQHKQNM